MTQAKSMRKSLACPIVVWVAAAGVASAGVSITLVESTSASSVIEWDEIAQPAQSGSPGTSAPLMQPWKMAKSS